MKEKSTVPQYLFDTIFPGKIKVFTAWKVIAETENKITGHKKTAFEER